MGAQVWRFDLDNTGNTGAATLASGGVIASLGGTAAADIRRFYYPPSVSLVSDEQLGAFLAIAIGSGHREHPLGTAISDRFYMIRDPYVQGPALNAGKPVYTAVTENQLLDVTSELAPEMDVLNATHGWLVRLGAGEKVLAPALTADNRIFFTTYAPPSGGSISCKAGGATGTSRLYTVAVGSGGPRLYSDQDPDNPDYDPKKPGGEVGDPSCHYRCEPTTGPIPPEPVLVFQDPETAPVASDPCQGLSTISLVVGTNVKNPGICTAPVLTYWTDN
jgi:type IV pilus assembly protein PilY1